MKTVTLLWIAMQATFITCLSERIHARSLLRTRKDAPIVCVEQIIRASKVQNGSFNRQAFVGFLSNYTNGVINVSSFQDLNLALVHIYWQTICSFDSEKCIITDEVPIDELLAQNTDDENATLLVDQMCHRINLYLFGSLLLTFSPTASPTVSPTMQPTGFPSSLPTIAPSTEPSIRPTALPSKLPSKLPSVEPSALPSNKPSFMRSDVPSTFPTYVPSAVPTIKPSQVPTIIPSRVPTLTPSKIPTVIPSRLPTKAPSQLPSFEPSQNPTKVPSQLPTIKPSQVPTQTVSQVPTTISSITPSISQYPTITPTEEYSNVPSQVPIRQWSQEPSGVPSRGPTLLPTSSSNPSIQPSWGESFILTFSVEVAKDPNTQMPLSDALEKCLRDGFRQKIVDLDDVCSRNDEQCPYSWQILVDSTPYDCFEGIDPNNNECLLSDFTVAIRSYEMSLEEYEVLKRSLSDAMKVYIRDELDTCIRSEMYQIS